VQYLRLFWAINLPGELKRYLYSEIKHPLQAIPADLKWVEEQNIHLTLQFLGDVESSRVNEIVRAVQGETGGSGPLLLDVKGVGCFPGRGRPRVFWAGLGGDVEELRLLHEKVRQAHMPLGIKLENRPFSPHITLARFRSPGNSAEFMDRARELVPGTRKLGSFKAGTVELMQSTLTGKGPVYKVLQRVLL